jgi:hypothetical protein
MAEKVSREERIAKEHKRRIGAIWVALIIALALGLAAWGSTWFHPVM